jgi:teichoic acid transport system ATP-binding protein
MDLVTRYCSAALLLEQGRIIKSGSAKDVVDEYNRRIVNCAKCEPEPLPRDEGAGAESTPDQPEKDIAAERVTAHMRESELAYQLNHDENRYGNGKAEIIEIGIDSLSDKVKYSFVHGERYRFRFKTLFHEDLDNPITAYTIKDIKGFDLTGTNTLFKDVEIGRVKKGEIVLTEFEQRMMLNPGGYLLSLGCAGFEDGEYVVYDRRYDVITFEVIAERPSVGIFDLDSAVTVSRVTR